MKYYEFEYWPFDKKDNIKEYWSLVEMPKEWAEHEPNKVNTFPYYDSPNLNWCLVELEAENQVEAFVKAWMLVIEEKYQDLPSVINEYYRVTRTLCLDEGDGIEIDWSIIALEESDLKYQLNKVVNIHSIYTVEVKTTNVMEAFQFGDSLIEQYKENKHE